MSRFLQPDSSDAIICLTPTVQSIARVLKGGPGSGRYPKGSGQHEIAPFQAARTALQTSIGEEIPVGVADHPVAIRAAYQVAQVLTEMRAKGYRMPTGIEVTLITVPNPRGEAANNGTLMISVPQNLPPEMSLDDAMALVYTGETHGVPNFAVKTFHELVVHEMGHLNRRPMASNKERWASAKDSEINQEFSRELAVLKDNVFQKAASQVSKYAANNPDEFVAEAFTKLYRGDTLQPEAARVYDALRGAKIR